MEVSGAPLDLDNGIVDQLLLSRVVAPDDLDRHRNPTLRDFLPDPSQFRDMDAAAERMAQAILTRETVTIYGDYDVDGATSSALLIRLMRMRTITFPTVCSKVTVPAARHW